MGATDNRGQHRPPLPRLLALHRDLNRDHNAARNILALG